MTVGELVEFLKKQPQDAEVIFEDDYGITTTRVHIDYDTVDEDYFHEPDGKPIVVIWVN